MSAEIYFDGGSKPAQMIVARSEGHEEGGFGQTVLLRDLLQTIVVGPRGEDTDAGGVAGKRTHGEGVDPEKRTRDHGEKA